VQAEARTLGIELHLLHASSDSDLDAAFATAARLQAAGLVVGPMFYSTAGLSSSLH
jgi:putative tryptophan/tyrosine transport system substrate-binding protein